MKTLPDWLAPGLDLVSIGINPSLPSVRAGYPFANPRNRFWPALNASRLLDRPVVPSAAAMQRLLERERIGFTDIVKKPSAMEKDLRAADYREGAPRLLEKLLAARPRILWFHGKAPYERLLRHAAGRRLRADWGLQPEELEGMRCFVTPNPSPANAAFSLAALIEWYDRLAVLRREPA